MRCDVQELVLTHTGSAVEYSHDRTEKVPVNDIHNVIHLRAEGILYAFILPPLIARVLAGLLRDWGSPWAVHDGQPMSYDALALTSWLTSSYASILVHMLCLIHSGLAPLIPCFLSQKVTLQNIVYLKDTDLVAMGTAFNSGVRAGYLPIGISDWGTRMHVLETVVRNCLIHLWRCIQTQIHIHIQTLSLTLTTDHQPRTCSLLDT